MKYKKITKGKPKMSNQKTDSIKKNKTELRKETK